MQRGGFLPGTARIGPRHNFCSPYAISCLCVCQRYASVGCMPLEDEINARLRHISREIRRFREELREAQRVPRPRAVERLIAADTSERHPENTAPFMRK